MVFISNPDSPSLILRSKESTAAKTAMIEKIPTVTPSNDKNVLNLLFTKALTAKEKLSANTLK